MPLPSLHISGDSARAWSISRAALYGAVIGAIAALFKMFAPWGEPHSMAAVMREFVGAALAFALVCAAASALRNFIARNLIWRDSR
jgi:hypothetical protein